MKIEETVLLLPCHTLDDFPYYYEGVEADNILAGYSALWHPQLIAHTGKTPSWQTSYNDDAALLSDRLVILSKVAENDLPGFWIDQARHEGATVIPASEAATREEIVSAALAVVRESASPDAPTEPAVVDVELVKDFLALGLCHLLSELLTVQMRYASLVDAEFFQNQLVESASAALAGDTSLAREKLQNCFDSLAQSRDHYYPVDGYLIDLTLIEPTTIGAALREELASDTTRNLLVSAETLQMIADRQPETLRAIREAVERGTACLIGGDAADGAPRGDDFAQLDNEAQLRSLRRGAHLFESLVGASPRIFGRRQFALSATLPRLLSGLGYTGAMHFTLDGGRFPEPLQSKTIWEGIDGSTTDAFARLPLDAALSESFLCFSQRMGESMDMDHVAVVCFAHWPGQSSPWFDDLRRIASFSPVLGKFVSLEHFLQETDTPRDHCRYGVDDYRSPYLRQAVAAGRSNPISASVIRSQTYSGIEQCQTLDVMAAAIDRSATASAAECNPKGSASWQDSLQRLAAALLPASQDSTSGYLVTNPLSAPRRLAVDVSQLEHPPALGSPIEAAYQLQDKREVLVEVPALGYAWIAGDASQTWQTPSGKMLAEDNIIRNEFAEVTVDKNTGAIKTVRCPGFRGNLLSQQLALRTPDASGGNLWGNDNATYSVMVAESVEVGSAGPLSAALTSRGRLVDHQGQSLANFRQTISLIRGRPVLELDIEIEPLEEADSAFPDDVDPWNAYFASRLAWADSTAELFRGIALGSHPTDLRQIEAPDFIEIRGAKFRTTLLTGGLTYHRLVDDHALDTILITGNEQARRFRLGIGLNVNQPHAAAQEFLAPTTAEFFPDQAAPAAVAGWLFHINARNVTATHWEPIKEDAATTDAKRMIGVRLRLLEVTGASTTCSVRSVYPIERAQCVDFAGHLVAELPTEQDRVMIELLPHAWSELEIYWRE